MVVGYNIGVLTSITLLSELIEEVMVMAYTVVKMLELLNSGYDVTLVEVYFWL